MIQPSALIKLFGYNSELIEKQTAVLSHAEALMVPPFEANCYNWVLGHIISSRSFALQLVGHEAVWTDEQRVPYRFGSANNGEVAETVLPLDMLLNDFRESQVRLLNGINNMSYEMMCQPSGYRDNSVGDSLAYFQFHEAHHIGQLMYLAQLAGKDSVWIS